MEHPLSNVLGSGPEIQVVAFGIFVLLFLILPLGMLIFVRAQRKLMRNINAGVCVY